MNHDALVSVVLPSYNMARFLGEALDSVLKQTYPHLEVHVVDDGSDDDPRSVVEPFLTDPRVHYHAQPNGGQAKAKNRGIRASRGEFIAFLDADDIWVKDKLERQLALFTRPEIGVVYTNFRLVDIEGQPLPTPPPNPRIGRITNELFVANFVTGMSSIVRRECFDRVGLFDESLPMSIDWDLWLRISVHYDFEFMDYVTYLYRQWPGQMSKNFERRFQCAVRVMRDFLAKNPGAVDPATARLAWAHTHNGRAGSLARLGKKGAALRSYLAALRAQPTYVPAWKGIAGLVLLP